MGLFRRNRHNDIADDPSPPLTIEPPKFTVVILEFPPNFDPSTTVPVNRRIMFQHETDSVVSGCSDCSCRMHHGRRRPECCLECRTMKEAMNNTTPRQTTAESPDPAIAEIDKPEVSTTTNHKQSIKADPPTLGLLSRIVAPSSIRIIKSVTPSSTTLTPPLTPPRKHHNHTQSADTGFFGKNLNSVFGHQSQSFTAESLSLDHELS
jgi:hypothetical protein